MPNPPPTCHPPRQQKDTTITPTAETSHTTMSTNPRPYTNEPHPTIAWQVSNPQQPQQQHLQHTERRSR